MLICVLPCRGRWQRPQADDGGGGRTLRGLPQKLTECLGSPLPACGGTPPFGGRHTVVRQGPHSPAKREVSRTWHCMLQAARCPPRVCHVSFKNDSISRIR